MGEAAPVRLPGGAANHRAGLTSAERGRLSRDAIMAPTATAFQDAQACS